MSSLDDSELRRLATPDPIPLLLQQVVDALLRIECQLDQLLEAGEEEEEKEEVASMAFTESQWEELFDSLGIKHHGPNAGSPLSYRGQSLRMYWDRNREGLLHVTTKNGAHYPSRLWQTIHPDRVKKKTRERHNVVPWPGKEEEAFQHLLGQLAPSS